MADNRSSFASQLTNPLLVVLVGLVFARSFDEPTLPERPGSEEEAPEGPLGTSVDALLTHDPLGPLLKAGPPATVEQASEFVLASRDVKTLVLACLLRGGPWPEDRERRIQTRTAVVRGIMDSGFVADESRSLRIVHKGDWTVPYDTFTWPSGEGPFQRIVTLWVDELALGVQPLAQFDALVTGLGIDSDRCTLRILGPTSSGELERWIGEAESTNVKREYRMYSPFSTVTELRQERRGPGAKQLVIAHRIGTDDELAKLLVMELRERIPQLMSFGETDEERDEPFTWFHGLPRSAAEVLKKIGFIPVLEGGEKARVVLLCESDSLYGRTWTRNLLGAWKALRKPDSKLGDIDFETYPYITVVDGVGLKHGGVDDKDPLVSQIDYIERIADGLAEGKPVSAIGILGSDTHDILQLLGTLRSRFPSAVFFTTDMNTKFLAPAHLPYTRNLIVASHGELGVERENHESPAEVRSGPVHFRDAYQVSVYRTTAELARNHADDEWKPEAPRLYEIGEGRAVPLNLPGTRLEDPVDPKAVYLARLAQRMPWLGRDSLRALVVLSCGGLVLWILVQGFRFLSADRRRWWRNCWKPVMLLAFAGVFLGTVRAGDGGPDHEQLEVALCFALLFAIALLLPRRGIAVLAVLLIFLLTRPSAPNGAGDVSAEGAVFHPLLAAAFLGVLFLLAAWHPARRAEPLASNRLFAWLRSGLIVAVLAVLFLRSVMGLVDAARVSASEPVEYFVGVSVWPTVILRILGIAVCVFGIAHIRARMLHEHEAIARQLREKKSVVAQAPRSFPWSWVLGLPTSEDQGEYDLAVVWDGLGKGLRSWPWLIFRLGLYVAIYVFFMTPLYSHFPISAPVRGELSYVCERASIFLLVVLFLALFFYVFESSFVALRTAARLRDDSTRLPRALIEAQGLGDDPLSGKLLRLELIERIARRCDRIVLWPVAVAALMALSRSSVFDRWCWPVSLILTFAIFFSLLTLCALNGQRVASGGLRSVQKALACVSPAEPGGEARRRQLQERLDSLRSGAFQPFYRHPLLRSLGLPVAAVALTKAIEGGWISL